MTELQYQTFPCANRVYVGADAFITEGPAQHGDYSRWVVIKDADQRPVVDLLLTDEARRDLGEFLLATPTPADPEPFVREPDMIPPAWDAVAAERYAAGGSPLVIS